MNTALLSILNLNSAKNIAIAGFFSNYPVESYYVENNSVLILGKSDQLWAHISSDSADELELILKKHHNKTKYYYSVEDWMLPLILKYGVVDWILTTNLYILDENVCINSTASDVAQIDKSYASYIYSNSDYKNYTSVEYIEDRLNKDISAGIMVDNKLVAWGFTHDDGSLGFLNVLKEHRNKGYAQNVLLSLIQMKKKENKPVFGNILQGNIASINLVTKLGFKLVRRVSWIKLY